MMVKLNTSSARFKGGKLQPAGTKLLTLPVVFLTKNVTSLTPLHVYNSSKNAAR